MRHRTNVAVPGRRPGEVVVASRAAARARRQADRGQVDDAVVGLHHSLGRSLGRRALARALLLETLAQVLQEHGRDQEALVPLDELAFLSSRLPWVWLASRGPVPGSRCEWEMLDRARAIYEDLDDLDQARACATKMVDIDLSVPPRPSCAADPQPTRQLANDNDPRQLASLGTDATELTRPRPVPAAPDGPVPTRPDQISARPPVPSGPACTDQEPGAQSVTRPGRRPLDAFGRDTRRLVRQAEDLACDLGSPTVETEHLALALLDGWDTDDVLSRLGADTAAIRIRIVNEMFRDDLLPATETETEPTLSPRARTALALAAEEADRELADPHHLLLGLVRDHESRAARALRDSGLALTATRERVAAVLAELDQKLDSVPGPVAAQPPPTTNDTDTPAGTRVSWGVLTLAILGVTVSAAVAMVGPLVLFYQHTSWIQIVPGEATPSRVAVTFAVVGLVQLVLYGIGHLLDRTPGLGITVVFLGTVWLFASQFHAGICFEPWWSVAVVAAAQTVALKIVEMIVFFVSLSPFGGNVEEQSARLKVEE